VKAAIYLRVSTVRQTTENQEPECLAACAAEGWQPVVYRETKSGAAARDVWNQVLADARAGRVGAIVVWSLDRMGRNFWAIHDAIRECDTRGIVVVSVREPWVRSLQCQPVLRNLFVSVLAFAAEVERTRTIERISASVASARRRGTYIGRPRVLSGDLAAMKLAVSSRSAGLSWSQIQSLLTASGFRRPDGRPHSRGSIQTATQEAMNK
jgi:putative DNA-invertase from lambdoid prophage Rac